MSSKPLVNPAKIEKVDDILTMESAVYKKPSQLVKSAFHLMLAESTLTTTNIKGGNLDPDPEINLHKAELWAAMDLLVIRNKPVSCNDDYCTYQKVTCVTIYFELVRMVKALEGVVDCCAYFPNGQMGVDNTGNGHYTYRRDKKANTIERAKIHDPFSSVLHDVLFMNIPQENLIVMEFAISRPECGRDLLTTIREHISIDPELAVQRFTIRERRLNRWRTLSTREEIFQALKDDLSRGGAFPTPVNDDCICQNIYCECRQNFRFMLDLGFIPLTPGEAHMLDPSKHQPGHQLGLIFLAPDLKLLSLTKEDFKYKIVTPEGTKATLNGEFKFAESFRDVRDDVLLAVEQAKISGMARLIKQMYTVTVNRKAALLMEELARVIKEKTGSEPVRAQIYSPITAMVAPHFLKLLTTMGIADKVDRKAFLRAIDLSFTHTKGQNRGLKHIIKVLGEVLDDEKTRARCEVLVRIITGKGIADLREPIDVLD